jgi:heptosyltransferase-2
VRAPNPLGDALMALPAMAAIREAMSGRQVIVAAPAAVAPLFEEITIASPNAIVVVDRRNEAAQLRDMGAGAILLLTNSFRTAWVSRRAGIPQRWGYRAHARGLLLTRAIAKPRQKVHQAEYYLHLVRELRPGGAVGSDRGQTGVRPGSDPGLISIKAGSDLGLTPMGQQPNIQITPATRARADAFLAQLGVDRARPLVGLAPGAAYGHAKRWPPARVAELAARLTAAGATCLLVGAAGDRDAGREIESVLPQGIRVVNVIGRTDLRLFAGLLASCQGFVSNDSGAMHLAAAAGVPVAAIFGPTDERVTAPLGNHDVIIHPVFCRPCMLRDCPIDHRCMRGIGVDRVFDAVSQRLATGATPAPECAE